MKKINRKQSLSNFRTGGGAFRNCTQSTVKELNIKKLKKERLLPVQLENFHQNQNYTSHGLRVNKHSRN